MCEEKLLKSLEELKSRPPLGQIYSLSANQVYELDYKERKFVYVWPLSSFTLTLEEYGNLAITTQTWTALPFPQGLRITASGQNSSVQMFVLCVDDPVDPTTAGGGSAVTIADGANVVEGTTTDTAITSDANGTISGKLRGLVKIFADVWDSVNHVLKTSATQSGTWSVTANAGTNLNTSTLALESGGHLATIDTSTAASKTDLDTIVTNTNKIATTQTSGGSTPFHAISAGSNNATSVKGSAGQLYGMTISNTNAAARFFKLYNKASAPSPGSDNALIVLTVQIPANSTVVHAFPEGMVFSTGIAFAAVANIGDTDNTSISASDLSMDLRYK